MAIYSSTTSAIDQRRLRVFAERAFAKMRIHGLEIERETIDVSTGTILRYAATGLVNVVIRGSYVEPTMIHRTTTPAKRRGKTRAKAR